MGAHDAYMRYWLVKGHGHDISAYLSDSVNLVGVVKRACTWQDFYLDYHTIAINIDYTAVRIRSKYPDPNVVSIDVDPLFAPEHQCKVLWLYSYL